MTIHYEMGSVFLMGAQTIINTVNCQGVMGKGLALQFKERYPSMYAKYAEQCKDNKWKPGSIYPWRHPSEDLIILNCSTKDAWRNPSRLEWIESIANKIVLKHAEYGIKSLAVPHMGCGLGGLDWDGQVRDVIVPILSKLPIDVFIVSLNGH